ncbi:MAG: FAD-dependent oxidoreductase, partial [Acidobacteriales bacterium]|nr:FAD-dependent oxidoreductase [Terriglobales bacterium]
MSRRHYKYLIVGGGVAGSAAVEAIRRRDPAGSVLFVGQEANRPYVRPPLTKGYLDGSIDRAAMSALPVNWYSEREVELRTGQRVSRLDTARFGAALSNGEEVSYDTMLLATGASPAMLRIPGADLPGLHCLRSIDDADRLLHALDTVRSDHTPRIAIIGAGLIGTELAATFSRMRFSVDLIDGNEYPWARIAGPSVGMFIESLLENRGVHVHSANGAARLDGDGRVQRIILMNGDVVPCDLAIAAVGMTIGRELLR